MTARPEIDGDIVGLEMEFPPALDEGGRPIAADGRHAVNEGIVLEKGYPAGFHRPRQASSGKAVFEGSGGRQGMNDVTEGARSDD